MQIGIVGSGQMGSTLARHFIRAGYEVAISNSRGPETLRELEAELGDRGHAVTARQAGKFGDVVVVSIPFRSYCDVSAPSLAGKVVIDTMNYHPDRDGHFGQIDDGGITSSEMLARRLPGARVVKAFNAIRWTSLRDSARPGAGGQRIDIPVSGNDMAAKETVSRLIAEIGFDPVDAGPLVEGGRARQTLTCRQARNT